MVTIIILCAVPRSANIYHLQLYRMGNKVTSAYFESECKNSKRERSHWGWKAVSHFAPHYTERGDSHTGIACNSCVPGLYPTNTAIAPPALLHLIKTTSRMASVPFGVVTPIYGVTVIFCQLIQYSSCVCLVVFVLQIFHCIAYQRVPQVIE